MMSISAMSSGQGQYYVGLAREDYYLGGGEPPGLWHGEGARALGLSDLVQGEHFSALFEGLSPDGELLVQTAGNRRRQPGWDCTFSAPKSVSVAWSQADAKTGAEIRAAHLAAVKAALSYLEQGAFFTRRGKGGGTLERAKMIAAIFEHGTSRAQDPQLHSHAILLNVCVREDGTTGTVVSKDLYLHKMAAGALYRAELASQLQTRLGFEIEREKTWFELKGVPKKLIDEFSKRRQEIMDALEKKGISGARASEIATLDTRHVKENISREALFEKWREVGQGLGWGGINVDQLLGKYVRRDTPEVAQAIALNDGLNIITKEQSHFMERDVVRRAAEEAQGRGVSAKEILAGVGGLIRDGAVALMEGRFSTPEILERERAMLARARELKEGVRLPVGENVIYDCLKSRKSITDEQRAALTHIMGPAGIQILSGMAGTGKTFVLDAAREMFEQSGYQVRGVSIAGKAAQGLEEGSGIKSSTITKLLWEIAEHLKSGQKKPHPLDAKTVLVIDEAGMVPTNQMARLIHEVAERGAKLILVGDAKQLQPIEAGNPFLAFGERFGQAHMKDIKRQESPWHRDAVKDVADGRARDALTAFIERGLLHVAETRADAKLDLLANWKLQGVVKPEWNLILTGTSRDAVELNRRIQSLRFTENVLGKTSVRGNGEKFYKGDRVIFRKNSTALGVKNGSLATITEVSPSTHTFTAVLDGKKKQAVTVNLKDYDEVGLGYAVTTHKAQGMTAQNVFVLTDEAMQSRELSYVQLSRSRAETKIFTTEIELGDDGVTLAKTMARSREKRLASDFLIQPDPSRTAHVIPP